MENFEKETPMTAVALHEPGEDDRLVYEHWEECLKDYRLPRRQKARYFMTAADWLFWDDKTRSEGLEDPFLCSLIWGLSKDCERIHDTTETNGIIPEDCIELVIPEDRMKYLGPFYKWQDFSHLFIIAFCRDRGIAANDYGAMLGLLNDPPEDLRIVRGAIELTMKENGHEAPFTFLFPYLVPKGEQEDGFVNIELAEVLSRVRDNFEGGYMREAAEHPEALRACPRTVLMESHPWRTHADDDRDKCEWLDFSGTGRALTMAGKWEQAGRNWFRRRFTGRELFPEAEEDRVTRANGNLFPVDPSGNLLPPEAPDSKKKDLQN